MRSLIRAFASRLKTIDRLAFGVLSLKRGRTGSSEPIRAKIVHLRIQKWIGGPDTPGKSQVIVIWVSIEISIWTPLEKVGPPPPPWKMYNKTIGPPL